MTNAGAATNGGVVPCLDVRGLAMRFGSLQVLEDVSLGVPAGERRAIIGPNGAGKSTLFNIIAGELRPTAGTVRLAGREITRLPPHDRAALGVARTFQTTTLCPGLSALHNVMLALIALRPARWQCLVPLSRYPRLREDAVRLLTHVGLADRAEAPVRTLGHGEQRQVEILLALAQRPTLLLLDEPTAGLAPADASLVTGMLRQLSRDVTLVLIEHDMDVVFDLVERITVLHHGRVVAEDAADAIRGHPTVQEIYFGGVL